MSAFNLALAQYPIDRLASFAEWQAKTARWVKEATDAGARLLVFPEYGAMELAALDPASMSDLQGSLRFVAGLAPQIDAHHRALAAAHDVHILAASLPCPLPDGCVVNRARLFTPGGQMGHQDKIVMTRFERERWGISGGTAIRLFRTAIGLIGISICYDIEFPMIARAQAQAGATLILAPSCTDSMQGYWRVRIGAQARALENQCFVAQAPTVGMAPWSPVLDENYGAAGLFAPPDGDAPEDGVLASGAPGQAQWVHVRVEAARVPLWRSLGAVRPFAHWDEQFAGVVPPALPCEVIPLG
ncbi:nitrilase-related carbon-nitrogen hydrolase [Sphingobium lignivorans]|uniref:Amidohydrolase n=1 Tax=Sphingobium lignivorans TaxID=2735886 RepID=A0ABR6NEU1_9SPHN|nr:putative amidohydrolase [Sphingobium lignivorans]